MDEITWSLLEYSLSSDHKKRFFSEYWQLKIRLQRLDNILEKWGELDFTPGTPKPLLIEQAEAMRRYLHVLGVRAEIEEIKL